MEHITGKKSGLYPCSASDRCVSLFHHDGVCHELDAWNAIGRRSVDGFWHVTYTCLDSLDFCPFTRIRDHYGYPDDVSPGAP